MEARIEHPHEALIRDREFKPFLYNFAIFLGMGKKLMNKKIVINIKDSNLVSEVRFENKQVFNQNKIGINGSGGITFFNEENGMLSNLHNYIFCSLQAMRVHPDLANAGTNSK